LREANQSLVQEGRPFLLSLVFKFWY